MSKQRLYIFVGYPGAGKTTVAKLIAEATGAVHLWADHERHNMFANPTHSATESAVLYEHLNERADQILAEGKSVIFDTNFNFKKDREYLRSIAAKHGAETLLIWMRTPKDVAQRRAVEQSHDQHTRIWGNMPSEAFERISSHLQPPTSDENPIVLDGTNLDESLVKERLEL